MITVCLLVRKGRFIVAQPYFERGDYVSLADAKRYAGSVGKLAAVQAGRSAGRVVEVLGDEADIHAVLRGILAERTALGDVPAEATRLGVLPRMVEMQVEAYGDGVPLADAREDLRGDLCVTIDPPGAKDHDDAIGVERLVDGGWRLSVHIADVSAYIPFNSPLDQMAAERGMSVYVPGHVEPMLPARLSSDLCSLKPGVDRGSVTTEVVLSPTGETVSVRFMRSTIRSARRLTYPQVDAQLAGSAPIDPVIDAMLADLDELTALLRAQRRERGALEISTPEPQFDLGEDSVEGVFTERETDSHRLVEECMLLANGLVGARLAAKRLPAIYRLHEPPEPSSVEALLAVFAKLGVPTPPLPDPLTPKGAARVVAEAARMAARYSEQTGRGTATFAPRTLRALQRAVYSEKPGPHSGLATQEYVHFTSPIRRYPDLVNHRSLLFSIGAEPHPDGGDPAFTASRVTELEQDAVKAERFADDVVMAHLLYDRMIGLTEPALPDVFAGEVVGLIKSGAFVQFGGAFDGYLPARSITTSERHELSEDGLALVGDTSGERIRLGDAIGVTVHRVDRARGKVELRRRRLPKPDVSAEG